MSATTGRTRDPNTNALWARVIMDELAASGVREVCLCPGSRSALLAHAAWAHEGLRVHSHVDERGAAFFALGVARATGRPAPVICSSGSAATHFYPAVVEAHMDGVPMIVMSADRPPELHGCGAGQAMDQQRLFGTYVQEYVNIAMPEPGARSIRHLRTVVDRAVDRSVSGPGVVHLNLPFREPLQPVWRDEPRLNALDDAALEGRAGRPQLTFGGRGLRAPEPRQLERVAARLRRAERGLIICGPMPQGRGAQEAVQALSRHLGFALLADPLSQLRFGPGSEGAATFYDAWTRSREVGRRLAPDAIVRVGAAMTSKYVHLFRERHPDAWEVLLSPDGRVHDWSHLADEIVEADVASAAEAIMAAVPARGPSPYAGRVAACEAATRRVALDAAADVEPLWEGAVARAVVDAVPEGGQLFVASSMPVRDVDAFSGAGRRPLPIFANRGVNGIDGQLATTFGLASTGAPTVALLGDVAFLHDAGSLLMAQRGADAVNVTAVVVDNRGGGIFSFLPIAGVWGEAEPIFTTPPEVDLAPIAEAYGLRVREVTTLGGLKEAAAACTASVGVDVIVVHVDRDANVARHHQYWDDVEAAALAALDEDRSE